MLGLVTPPARAESPPRQGQRPRPGATRAGWCEGRRGWCLYCRIGTRCAPPRWGPRARWPPGVDSRHEQTALLRAGAIFRAVVRARAMPGSIVRRVGAVLAAPRGAPGVPVGTMGACGRPGSAGSRTRTTRARAAAWAAAHDRDAV